MARRLDATQPFGSGRPGRSPTAPVWGLIQIDKLEPILVEDIDGNFCGTILPWFIFEP